MSECLVEEKKKKEAFLPFQRSEITRKRLMWS